MRCVVSNCDNESSQTSPGVTYHTFPTEPSHRAVWFAALQVMGFEPEEHGTVCSKHFLKEDWLVSGSGERMLKADAVPIVDLQVCRICFATDCKLYSMTTCGALSKAYATLTGLLVENQDYIPPYLCSECVHRLQNCEHFRNTSLRAHFMMMEIVKYHGCVTLESIQSVKVQSSLNLKQTDCDLDIEHTERDNVHTDGPIDLKQSPDLREDVANNGIKVENDDLTNQDICNAEDRINDNLLQICIISDDITTDDIKHEDNDNVNTEDAVDEDSACISNLSKDVHEDVKAEDECVVDQDSCNIDSNAADTECQNVLEGEDYSSDIPLPLREAKQKAKLSTRTVQQVTEKQTDLPHTKVDTHQSLKLFSNTFSSDVCSHRTNNENQLSTHLKGHAVTVPCSQLTTSRSLLTGYFTVHSGEKPYLCDVCSKVFYVKFKLLDHMRTHLDKKPYCCNVCNKSFVKKTNLVEHLKIHSGKKKYSCDICNKGFIQRASLTVHMRTHSGDKPYSCNVCSKSFNQKCHLAIHLRTHSGKKEYICDSCDKGFNHKSNLIRHLRIHSGEEPYSCNICLKTFKSKGNLTVHWAIHSGDKPYCCKVCKKCFTQRSSLAVHLKIHSNKKEYACDICSKGFNHRSNLIRHMRTHCVNEPYSCNVCYKKFKTKILFTLHKRSHSDIQWTHI